MSSTQHEGDHDPPLAERRLHEPKHPVDVATFVLAILGFVVAAASTGAVFLQWDAMEDTLAIMRSEDRPWIAVYAAHSAAPRLNQDLNVELKFGNSGAEPATKIRYFTDIFVAPAEDSDGRLTAAIQNCRTGANVTTLGVLPPTGERQFSAFQTLYADRVNEEVVSGAKTVVFAGCFSYEDDGKVRYSDFCFFNQSSLPVKGWNFCKGEGKNNAT